VDKPSNADLIRMILDDETSTLEEEELLNLLMQQRVSRNISVEHKNSQTLGERMADRIALFAGSWKFIGIFIGVLVLWIIINSFTLFAKPFDPYPFILMNLILSCVAAIQAPVIMMSQNRQEKKDRLRAEHDYEVNLKAEILVEDIIKRLEKIEQNQARLAERLIKDAGAGK
jgi:uncharacterized membrane protein